MKKIAVFLLLFIPIISRSQLHEQFDDNRNKWRFITDNARCSIESGKYILETLEKNTSNWVKMPAYFDPGKDFTLEASFVQKSGSDNNGFGLFW